MTDHEIQGDAEPMAASAVLPLSFGARLAAAREKEGLSVGEMAGRLRLHVNQVRALESENLAQLPEPAYVRGFVRSYARSLGLDPAPLVEDFNSKITPPSGSVVEGMARARDYSPVRAAAQERASRSLVLGLSVVALVALGALGWYATRQAREPTPVAAPAPAALPAQPVPQGTAAGAVAPDAGQSPVVEPAPAPSHPLNETSVLALTFNGPSWVEVTDAGGTVLLSRMANAGEVVKPTGTAPLSVVIGDASKVTVSVRGQPFNLEAATRANIARFTVK